MVTHRSDANFLVVSSLVLDLGLWLIWEYRQIHAVDALVIGIVLVLLGSILTVATVNDIRDSYGRR